MNKIETLLTDEQESLLVAAEKQLDYAVLHAFAEKNRISYNELCTAVRAAIAASKGERIVSKAKKPQYLEGFDRSKYTPEQWDWCLLYERQTGFDPHTMRDFEVGDADFYEAAREAVQWYEDHTSDAHLRISHNIPGWEQKHD